MRNVRLIARLDVKAPNLVKGIHFEGLRVLGKPEKFAHFYYKNGADELIISMDWLGVRTGNQLKFYNTDKGYAHEIGRADV